MAESSAAQDWREQREPRAPRRICGQILEMLGEVRDEAAQLIDDSAAGSGEHLLSLREASSCYR